MFESNIGALIVQLLKEKNISQSELARQLGVTSSAISIWKKDGKITKENLFKFTRYFEIDAEAFLLGKIVYLKTSTFAAIPILNEVQAGKFTSINEDFSDIERLPVPAKYSHCFALIVKGKSMNPEYLEGDYIIVDPNKLPTSGNDVVAALENEDSATFKRYREKSNTDGSLYFELYPLNDNFPTYSSLNKEIVIKGVKVAFFRAE